VNQIDYAGPENPTIESRVAALNARIDSGESAEEVLQDAVGWLFTLLGQLASEVGERKVE
jgi:hypothetical protein